MTSSMNEQRNTTRQQIRDNSMFNSAYVTMNALSAVIACYGLLADSSAVVIGAMIVAMLLGPLMGIALAVVDADNKLLFASLLAEAGGAIIVFVISVIIGRIHQDIPLGMAIISRTSPNIMDLVIALAGGAAGAYATISPRISASIVGVAIATALVPPLCACGITLARGDTNLALGGFLLFVANLVAIQIASSVVFAINGYHNITVKIAEDRASGHLLLLFLHGPSLAMLVALSVFLSMNFRQSLATRHFDIEVRNTLKQQLLVHPGSYLADLRIEQDQGKTVIMAVVRTPFSLGPDVVAKMQKMIPSHRPPVELHMRSIITKESTASGWLHEPVVPPSIIDHGIKNWPFNYSY